MGLRQGWARDLLRLASGAVAWLLLTSSSAEAAASNKIGTAAFITPAAADAYYGSATASTAVITSVRAAELKELARALKNDPDLIYEHVRNNMAAVWTYGLTKGGVGVTIDRSGTAFDQAHLMVELLREAGFTAAYKVGTITLTGQQFADWTGITSATAACQLLSSGGIPGAINGSTSATCAYGSATVTSIQLGHVWVDVTISGTHYVFDPAYKPHTFKTGLNLNTAANLTPGQPLSQSAPLYSGSTSGVSYVQRLWIGGVANVVNGHAVALTTTVNTSGTLADVVGGQSINPETTATLRQTTLPYTSNVLRTYTGGIPDQYRTMLAVQITKQRPGGSTPVIANAAPLYADELYGRRLIFDTNFDPTGATFTGNLRLVEELGAAQLLATGTYSDDPTYSKGVVTLTLNMPYAASSGGYMDTTFQRAVNFALPFTIVHGYGDIGRGLIDKWGQRQDTPMPAAPANCDVCLPNYKATKGDGRRELLAASWLAQASRAAQINAQIAKSVWAQHYSIGVVSADATVYAHGTGPYTYAVTDSFDRVDVETGYSLTSKTATALDRRAAIQSAAAAMDALKGSVVSQVADLPDTTSVATMLEWGNLPPDQDGGGGVARKVYHYPTSTEAAQALSLAKVDNVTSTTNPATHNGGEPSIGDPETQQRRTALANAISSYVTAGFKVTASDEAFLGPGQRGGGYRYVSSGVYSHDPSRQRGGAMVATKYDANGDPTEIAHVVVGADGPTTGGGAGAQTYIQAQYDAALSADVLKGRYVNARPGAVAVASPAVVKSGSTGFPQSLSGELTWRGGDVLDTTSVAPTRPKGPWTSNWDSEVMVGSSGLEAMGESDVRGAYTTIAAFLVAQDLYKSAASAQRDAAAEMVMSVWLRSLSGNVSTVALGTQSRQFVRPLPLYQPTTWTTPGAAPYAGLTEFYSPRDVAYGHPSCATGGISYSATRGYMPQASAIYKVANNKGDVQTFTRWSHDYLDSSSSQFCTRQKGFRLTNWTWFTVSMNLSYSTPTYAPPALTAVANNMTRGIVFSGANITNGLGGGNLRQVTTSTTTISGGLRYDHTDPAGAVTKFETSQIGQGYYQRYALDKVFDAATDLPAGGGLPSMQIIYDTLGRVKETKDRFAYQGAGLRMPVQNYLADGIRGETVDPTGARTIVYNEEPLQRMRTISPVGNVVTAYLDGRGRTTKTINPEGDEIRYEYDDHNDVTKTTVVAKPGSPEAASNIVTEAAYELVGHNPIWTKDAKGAQTDYVINGWGLVTKSTAPAAQTGEVRPETDYTYGSYMLPTGMTDWWDRQSTVIYNADGSPYATYVGDQYTYYTNNAQGQPTSVDGPRTDVTDVWTAQYDNLGRQTLKVAPAVSPNPSDATKTTYDPVGRVTKVERGTYSGSTFTPLETTTTDYDAVGNAIKVTAPAGVTQMSYDAANRVKCTAIRMNPAVYGSLPVDACTPSTVGANGPDRITRNTYDEAGRVLQVEVGVGSSPVVLYSRTTYTANGKPATLIDANNNKSAYAYDGFDRLKRLYFPSTTRGANLASTTDYEEYGYDVNGNRTSLRKRGGQTINYVYDALNRLTLKDIPDGIADDVMSTYAPGGGPLTQLTYGSPSQPGAWLSYAYDAMGRPSEYGVQNVYDNAGNRTQVLSGGQTFLYTYDVLNRMKKIQIQQSGTPIDVAELTYGPLNRRSGIMRANGANTSYTYDAAGRLSGLTHVGVPTSTGTAQTFDYNPASQTISAGQSNSLYQWTGQPITTKNATHDGLNRDAAVVAALGYDANGNLTFDGTRTFTYDVENRLRSVTGPGLELALTYDVQGRLVRLNSTEGQVGYYQYNGSELLYAGGQSSSQNWRYFAGPGTDEYIAAYNAFGTLQLHADRQGSIIGTSASTGAITPITYGPYGEPQTWAGQLVRYTGQMAIPQAQLYYYKARMYDPMMGRFLQTDPSIYNDGPNIYGYVHGDPVNFADPTGLGFWSWLGNLWGNVSSYFSSSSAPGQESQATNPGPYQPDSSAGYGGAPVPSSPPGGNTIAELVVTAQKIQEANNEQSAAGALALGNWVVGAGQELGGCLFDPGCAASMGPLAAVPRVTQGLSAAANYAQLTFRATFSSQGRFAGRTVADVSAALRSGQMSPADVPVQYIVREGNTLILNTRSAQALEQAGIPRSQWNAINMTGDAGAELRLTNQLQRNGLTSTGTTTVQLVGGQ